MIEGQKPELTGPVEQTKREKLTDEQLGNLISAVGNNAAKMITLLAMRDGNIYSKRDLHAAHIFSQGVEIGWKTNPNTPFSYCTNSFAPIGLVARETLNSNLSSYGYQITDYGKKIGIPFCGLILDWSARNNVSLPQLWGSTNSVSHTEQVLETSTIEEFEFKKRAPITTLKILYELLTTPNLPTRAVDLTNRLSEHRSNFFGHLQRLAEAGIIEYQTIEINKTYSAYKLASLQPAGELQIYQSKKSLTQAVFSILQQHPSSYLTIIDVVKLLPQKIQDHLSQPSLSTKTSGVLAFLKRNGYLEGEKFNALSHSEINLNDEQRIILTELLEILYRFQSQDSETLSKGRKLADEIIANPPRVSGILRNAKEQSSQANKTSVSETIDLIKYLIISHPGTTNKELRQLLEREDKKLRISAIRKLTVQLEAEDALSTANEGSVKRFFPKETPK